jgi:hypothetical protein
MEHTMHRFMIAALLGLGLLSAGGIAATASAHSATPARAASPQTAVAPVHYENHRRYVPPPRHWHRPAPWSHHQSHRPQPHHNQYGWR